MDKRGIILTSIIILLLASSVSADFAPSIQESEKEICRSTTDIFTLFIEGSGNIKINKDGTASAFSTIIPSELTLAGKRPVFIYITPNSKTQPDSYDLNLKINDGTSEKTIPLKINVKDCNTFEVSVDQLSKEVCGCNSQSYKYTVKNTGIYQENYALSVKGEARNIVKLDKNEVTLNPSESSTITATVNAPCNQEGAKTFSLNIESKTSKSIASVDNTVTINNCFDYTAITEKESVDMCEHTVQEIPLSIENTADIDNSYKISIVGPAWANLDKKELGIRSKGKGQVNLVLSPDYGVSGDFKININIESSEGSIKKESVIETKVNKCHSASIDIVTSNEKICQSTSKTIPVSLQNTGEFDKTFELSSDVNWATLSKSKIDVKSSDKAEIELALSPTAEITPGKYPVKILLVSLDDSKITEEDSIEVEVVTAEKCYKPSIESKSTIEVEKETPITSDIVIKNEGEEVADYEVTITGTASEFIHLNPAAITVNPKATETLQLYIAPTIRTEPGTYPATISIKEKNSSISDEKEITIEVSSSGETVVEGNKITGTGIIEFKEETTITESTEFMLEGEEHKIEIEEVSETSVTIKITSDPIFVVLNISETKEVDIDDDGINDLKLFLESVENGEPKIKVQELASTEISEGGQSFFSKYRNWIIGLIIAIILVILASIFFSDDEDSDEELEEDKEEGKLRIGRYILILIVIGIIYWLFRNYPLVSYIGTYRIYIIIAIIILILLILVINYWKSIVKFFEEEDEEQIKEKVKETIGKKEEVKEEKSEKKEEKKKTVRKKTPKK